MLLICCLSECYCFCCLRLCRILRFWSPDIIPKIFPLFTLNFCLAFLLLLKSYRICYIPFTFNACLTLLLYGTFPITETSNVFSFVQKLCLTLLILCWLYCWYFVRVVHHHHHASAKLLSNTLNSEIHFIPSKAFNIFLLLSFTYKFWIDILSQVLLWHSIRCISNILIIVNASQFQNRNTLSQSSYRTKSHKHKNFEFPISSRYFNKKKKKKIYMS